ncbi:MAG: DUF3089 domain-containing protein [Prevotella sp.]|nr:DUF3089 domain-containing protein [Prevotella sp.]
MEQVSQHRDGSSSLLRAAVVCTMAVLLVSWGFPSRQEGPVPPPPDYADSSQWFIRDRQGVADVFYIISTETGDHMIGDDTCHYADTYDSFLRDRMCHEMIAVDSFYSGRCNYYSPYYRQVSMQSWGSMEQALKRLPLALSDVQRSWDYYLRHFNQGRPFILAGFSQGAHAMTDLIKRMPDSVAKRMVAAYAIGYKVTQADMDSCPLIRPAQGRTDLGVTICFNSVKSPECEIPIVSGGNKLCINPVNWRTDTVSTPFVLYGRRRNDTLRVRCHETQPLLIVEGYQQRQLLPVIGRPGNYHNMELKFYYPYIRQNIADRVQAYFTSSQ